MGVPSSQNLEYLQVFFCKTKCFKRFHEGQSVAHLGIPARGVRVSLRDRLRDRLGVIGGCELACGITHCGIACGITVGSLSGIVKAYSAIIKLRTQWERSSPVQLSSLAIIKPEPSWSAPAPQLSNLSICLVNFKERFRSERLVGSIHSLEAGVELVPIFPNQKRNQESDRWL